MATVIFKCNLDHDTGRVDYPRYIVLHGDRCKVTAQEYAHYTYGPNNDRIHYDYYCTRGDIINIPRYGKDESVKLTDFKHKFDWEDPTSDKRYEPICLYHPDTNGRMWYHNDGYELAVLSRMFNKVLNLIGDVNDHIKYASENKYEMFVVAEDVDLYFTYVNSNMYKSTSGYYVITNGEPTFVQTHMKWVDRFMWPWQRINCKDPEKYKKLVDVLEVFGQDGFRLISLFSNVSESYNGDIKNSFKFFKEYNPIRYTIPNTKSAREINEEIANDKAKKEFRLKIERQKSMDGYCDKCGCDHAEYIQDPFNYTGWLCRNCYDDMYND